MEINKFKKIEPSIQIDAEIVEGNPANKIIEVAKKEKHDLIVMGKKGMSRIEEILMGSVTHKVLNLSEVTVTVVT